MQDANAAYCLAISWLLQHPGDAAGAVQYTEHWAATEAVPEVQEWLVESARPGNGPDCTSMIGFVRWGFVHAFRYAKTTEQVVKSASLLLRSHAAPTGLCSAVNS